MRHAVILAGGGGTRLWPLSRSDTPKQLIALFEGATPLELAADRLRGVVPEESLYVCAPETMRGAASSRLPGLRADRFIGEPVGRDTLAAVGLSAALVAARDPDAVLGVFTSDQVIRPVPDFRALVARAYELASALPRSIVTFAVTPTHPATGYGYLELGEAMQGGARRVRSFREKPDPETAARFFHAGADRWAWNSGMFVFRASTVLSALASREPRTSEALLEVASSWGTPEGTRLVGTLYPGLRRVSFDVALMEPLALDPSVTVVALGMDLDWVDISSWPSFASVFPGDEKGNVAVGKAVHISGCSGTLAVSEEDDHLVAVMGCEDLVVVHTARATLVCRKAEAEQVKRLHGEIAARFGARFE